MKKSFLFLPLSVALLAACSNNTPAPIESADGQLSPGIMQPVDGANSPMWQPKIQQNSMPSTMGAQPTYQPVQPSYQPVSANTATPAYQAPAPKPSTKTITKTVSDCTPSTNVNVPRNPTTNAPDYSQIQKGSYKGNSYKVKKGDTMYLIAYLAAMDVRELAALNNMKEPYSLTVGQTLKIANCSTKTITQTVPVKPVEPPVTYTPGANGTQFGSDGTVIGPIKAGVGVPSSNSSPTSRTTNSTPAVSTPVVSAPVEQKPVENYSAPAASGIAWQWPTNGKILEKFTTGNNGTEGIDIGGSRGQSIKAAADGVVAYAGNALPSYGNLIIIKHGDDYLSSYAHNDKLLVSQQQHVKAGQEIAKMGSSRSSNVKLHFEIRHKGKPVDPLLYLPRR